MNIYIHVEISARELDAKLLLAVFAASEGHQVLISDLDSLILGIEKKLLPPGIFHTKSLTPTIEKIKRHQMLIDRGFLITSMDEEGALDIETYEQFSKTRYSDTTIKQSSAVFTWGDNDTEALNRHYTKDASKIFKTGSPRVDIWKPIFSDYWSYNKKIPSKPFLLISSNMGYGNNYFSFYELVKKRHAMGYYEREPEYFYRHFERISEQYLTTLNFIKAIRHLSEHNNGYDIILRPHPTENIDAWKLYLKGLPNVHVIREDSISFWINKAFAVMHNGCTTAIETTISEKPLLSYVPFKQKYTNNLPNKLGYLVETKEELTKKVNEIFNNSNDSSKETNNTKQNIISKKIYIDTSELSAIKIVKIWNKIDNGNLSKKLNLNYFKLLLRIIKSKKKIKTLIKNLVLFKSSSNNYVDHKFGSLNINDIEIKINNIKKILKIDTNINFQIISDRTIIIKK